MRLILAALLIQHGVYLAYGLSLNNISKLDHHILHLGPFINHPRGLSFALATDPMVLGHGDVGSRPAFLEDDLTGDCAHVLHRNGLILRSL